MGLRVAVDKTLKALGLDGDAAADTAAVELARVYARHLDQAAAAERAADKALREAVRAGDDALVEHVTALRAKLGERACIDRLGARLHALLVDLQATPKARCGARPPAKPAGKLYQLRSAR